MLRKIDCVMIRVDDLEAATAFYADAFGLRPLWHYDNSVGIAFPETDAEIVLHTNTDMPNRIEVHYVVDDVLAAVHQLTGKGCEIVVQPFDIRIGKCVVIKDPFGTMISILDATKGFLQPNL